MNTKIDTLQQSLSSMLAAAVQSGSQTLTTSVTELRAETQSKVDEKLAGFATELRGTFDALAQWLEGRLGAKSEGGASNPQLRAAIEEPVSAIIDSIKAITTLDANDYLKIYGTTSERALLFTGVKFGRSPMIAVKAHPLKPAMVVYVQPENIDELAVKLAELENILLARTDLESSELIERLERLG